RYTNRQEIAPSPRWVGARIIKDIDGSILRAVRHSAAPIVELKSTDATQELACAIDSQIYAALHNARGATWSAMGEVVYRQSRLYALLAASRGIQTFGLRETGSVLRSAEERRHFEESWPAAPRAAEVRRAASALWRFTMTVRDAVTSQVDSGSIPLVDEAALQRAVNAIYTWA